MALLAVGSDDFSMPENVLVQQMEKRFLVRTCKRARFCGTGSRWPSDRLSAGWHSRRGL